MCGGGVSIWYTSFFKRYNNKLNMNMDVDNIKYKTHEDMVDMLKKRFPQGLTLYIKPETIDNVKNYITRKLDEPFVCQFSPVEKSANGLNATIELSPSIYNFIYPTGEEYENSKLQEKMQSIEDASTSMFLNMNNKGKNLMQAKVEISNPDVLNYLYLENLNFHYIASILLQNPQANEKDIKKLSSLREEIYKMHQFVPNPMLSAMLQIEYGENWQNYKTVNSEKDSLVIQPLSNGRGIICFEKGKLGYVHISSSRFIRNYGERLKAENMNLIHDLNNKRNFVVNKNELALYPIGPSKLFYDKDTDNVVSLQEEKTVNENAVLCYGHQIMEKKDSWVDITGRISNPVTYKNLNGEWHFRCKVDGEWKSSEKFNHTMIKGLEPHDVFALAAKMFIDEIQQPKEQQSRSYKL